VTRWQHRGQAPPGRLPATAIPKHPSNGGAALLTRNPRPGGYSCDMEIQKLQRTVIDALEDVKAQDIKVFNTTHLTSLFDRVVIASATSNRQTRALASSVSNRARALRIPVAIEGEGTGEWVVVDLGDIVVHIMQPAIRQYYNLEEIWGGKPVRVKLLAQSGRPALTGLSGATYEEDDV
jgi:ribosome-associated protein